MSDSRRYLVVAFCETCGREFYRSPGKFCDVHFCRGWVRHVLRAGRKRDA